MPRYGGHLDLRAHETGDGPLDISERTSTAQHALPRDGLAFPGDRREEEPAARASRRWGLARTDAEAAERAARGAGTLGRSPALWRCSRARLIHFQPVNPTLTACFSKNLNCATKMVDAKIVDETSVYNICKGRPMCFSTV
jgi:hypothetical protein